MEPSLRQLVTAVHDASNQIVFVAAGAGTEALADLLAVGGASRTLLEAVVPYSSAAFADFLGQRPRQYVSPKSAKLLAGRALTRASLLSQTEAPLIGLACTATIATDRIKRGEHRAHVAVWQPGALTWYGLQLQKGVRTRIEEERVVSRLILNALAAACDVDLQLPLRLTNVERVGQEKSDFATVIRQLFHGDLPFVGIHAHGLIRTQNVRPQILLPGAFNPLHEGHLEMARAAAQILNRPVAFELSITNVDKDPLTPPIIGARLAQFAGRYPVYASRAATFIEKALLYPGATFVVGYDTARRILHPRYYDGSRAKMRQALSTLRAQGCQLLVAGRKIDGAFHNLESLTIPGEFADLFQGIPEETFRCDISSTELRRQGKKGSR